MENEQRKTQLLNDFRDIVEQFKGKLAEYTELKLRFAGEVLDDYEISGLGHLFPELNECSNETDFVKKTLDATNELWGLDYASNYEFFEYGDKSTAMVDEIFTLFKPKSYYDERVFEEYQPLLESVNEELNKLTVKITKAGFEFLKA